MYLYWDCAMCAFTSKVWIESRKEKMKHKRTTAEWISVEKIIITPTKSVCVRFSQVIELYINRYRLGNAMPRPSLLQSHVNQKTYRVSLPVRGVFYCIWSERWTLLSTGQDINSTRRNILLFFCSRYMRPTHSTKIVCAGLITPTNFSKRNRNEMKWGKTASTLNVLRNSLFTSSSSSPSSSLSFSFFSLTRNECVERVEIYVSHTNGKKVLKRHCDVNCNN